VWHFSPKGLFTVRLAYHAIIHENHHQEGTSLSSNGKIWNLIWKINIHQRFDCLVGELVRESSLPKATLHGEFPRLACHVTFASVGKSLMSIVCLSAPWLSAFGNPAQLIHTFGMRNSK